MHQRLQRICSYVQRNNTSVRYIDLLKWTEPFLGHYYEKAWQRYGSAVKVLGALYHYQEDSDIQSLVTGGMRRVLSEQLNRVHTHIFDYEEQRTYLIDKALTELN